MVATDGHRLSFVDSEVFLEIPDIAWLVLANPAFPAFADKVLDPLPIHFLPL